MPPRAREFSALPAARRASLVSILALACASLCATTASADSNDNDGFESFAVGDPVGQQGWTAKDIGGYHAAAFDLEIVDPSLVWPGGELGSRALRVSNGVTTGGYGNQLQTPSLADEAGEAEAENYGLSGGTRQSRLSGSVTFASATRTYQQGLSMSLSPDRGDGARMSWFRLSDEPAGLQVEVAYYDGTEHEFGYEVIATGLSRDQTHTLDFSLDLVDGPNNDVLWVSVGDHCGSWAHSGSWEDYHRDYAEGNSTKTVDSLLWRVAGPPQADLMGGGFLFDAVSLTSSMVAPLPPIGTPTAPVAPAAHVTFASVSVTGAPVVTNPCSPVTEYAVSAWPLGGKSPVVFTSPTPDFTFATPFQGAFTLTMAAVNDQGSSAQVPVTLSFDPVFSGGDEDDAPDDDTPDDAGSGTPTGGGASAGNAGSPDGNAAVGTAPGAAVQLASTGNDESWLAACAASLVVAGATALMVRRSLSTTRGRA